MNPELRDKLSTAATAIELALGLIILIACVVTSIGIIFTTDAQLLFEVPSYLQTRMSDACVIIIGIELIKMITSFTLDSVVDVMLLAIARQMIVEHTSPIENLLAVISVGLLFAIRKFLYISRLDRPRPSEVREAVREEVFGHSLTRRKHRKEGVVGRQAAEKQEPAAGHPAAASQSVGSEGAEQAQNSAQA